MRPLLRFVLLGGVLFAAERGVQHATANRAPWARPEPIVLSAAQLSALHADWRRRTGREPAPAQWQAAVRQLGDEEILLREALRLGLNRSDPVVRGRLIQNLRFAYPDTAATDDSLLQQALALRMDERDLVVRRRLVQRMQQRLSARATVSEAAVQATLAAHPERYGSPRRVAFTQILVSADRHPQGLAAAAAKVQAQLGTAAEATLGDASIAGRQFGLSSAADIRKIFGAAVAQAALAAPVGQWVGPVASVYGLHFIKVEAEQAAQPADPAHVAARASYAALEQQEQATVAQALVGLRQRYPLQLPASATPTERQP